MSLTTHSAFYFGYEIDSTNQAIDFDEGGGEIQASIAVGSYTLTEVAAAWQTAMNNVGGQTYTVTVDRTTRKLTISATSAFTLLTGTGTRLGSSAWSVLGFDTGSDSSSATSHESDNGAGTSYTTQFILQSHVASEDFQQSAEAVVNKSASGAVEVVKFGDEQFIEGNFMFVTDQAQAAGAVIRNRATGVADFRTFAQHMATKAPFEYMADEDTPATFEKVILESWPGFRDGTGYRLREMTNKNLAGYFESGILRFRVVS